MERLLGPVAVVVFAAIISRRRFLFVVFILFVAIVAVDVAIIVAGLADRFFDGGGTKESKGLAVYDVVAPFFVWH